MGEGPRVHFLPIFRPHPTFSTRLGPRTHMPVAVFVLHGCSRKWQRMSGEGEEVFWSGARPQWPCVGPVCKPRQPGGESGQGLGRQDLTPSPWNAGGTFLPLSLQPTVQLTMSSPGAPPPPLSPEGATEGAVRAKGHRRGLLMGSEGTKALSLSLCL